MADHLYKVLVIGEYAAGKTSIIRRFCESYFTPNYKLTIGVDFAVKEVEVEDQKVTLQLWDVAGHERFGTMTRVYYKYAIAAVVVYDLSRPATLEAVTKWRDDVNSKVVLANDEPIPIILLANKCDLDEVTQPGEEMQMFARENGFLAFFPTSAQADIGINEAMDFLVKQILRVADANKPSTASARDNIVLGGGGETSPPKRNRDWSDDFNDCCQ
eukprot:TRINITY_DN3238_c0_g1_i2.p1 TRINITY_DN3238_c0_g1~~TRINITY_DN3238_c0_g1_i2.p1  ORF type:complete len:215 (-),score=27.75 TRINITY_DN3238_c0_g1_i2:30-674(-)